MAVLNMRFSLTTHASLKKNFCSLLKMNEWVNIRLLPLTLVTSNNVILININSAEFIELPHVLRKMYHTDHWVLGSMPGLVIEFLSNK